MRSICVALLLVCVAVAAADPVSAEKRLLKGLDLGNILSGVVCTLTDLVGGVLDGVLNLVEDVLSDLHRFLNKGLLPAIFGKHGILGGLLCNIFDGGLVANLLNSPLVRCLAGLVDSLVCHVSVFVLDAVDRLLAALNGVVLSVVDDVYDVLVTLPSDLVCLAYYLIPDCRPACNRICKC